MNSIHKLTEMGFSSEQAEKALRASNGDVEAAIAYLFEEPIEVLTANSANNNTLIGPIGENSGANKENTNHTVGILNPRDVPDFATLQQQENHPNQPDPLHFEHYEYSDDRQPLESTRTRASSSSSSNIDGVENHRDVHMRSLISDLDSNSGPSTPSIYDEEEMEMSRTQDTPPVVLIDRAGSRENIVVPLVTILMQLPRFRQLLISEDVGEYDENWYKGDPDEDAEIELRRAIAYLYGHGHRAFISSHGLVRSLLGAKSGMEMDELVPHMYESLISYASDSLAMQGLLQSTVESIEEEIQNKMYLFEVDLEYRASTIYGTLNGLFWSQDLENLGNIRLRNTGKVLTFQFMGDEDSYQIQPFELDEKFYPQAYSQAFAQQLVEMHQQKLEVGDSRSSTTSKIMQWSSFEGKRVAHFLDQANSYLTQAGDKETAGDLDHIKSQTANTVAQLNEDLETINRRYLQLDVTNPTNLVSKMELENAEPYLLAGVVFSDCEYYYRTTGGQWIYIGYQTSSSGLVVGYTIEKRELHILQEQVRSNSKDAGMVITLVYVAASEFEEKEREREQSGDSNDNIDSEDIKDSDIKDSEDSKDSKDGANEQVTGESARPFSSAKAASEKTFAALPFFLRDDSTLASHKHPEPLLPELAGADDTLS